MSKLVRRGYPARNRGVATVELAIVAPILILIMFAIVELGLMFRSAVQLNTAAREAARSVAAGESEAVVIERISGSGTSLDLAELTMTLDYRGYAGSGMWDDAWLPVESAGDQNTVPLNAQVRATLNYNHHLIIPGLFRFLLDDEAAGTKTVTGTVTMARG